MKLKYLLAASIVSLAATTTIATPAFAQQIVTEVEGRVTDENGNPLAGSVVTVTNTSTNAVRTVTTGSDGTFRVTALPPGGPYEVTANSDGFEGQTVQDVYTALGRPTSFSFGLTATAAGASDNVIIVSGSRAGVAQVAVGPGQAFGSLQLEAFPSITRDIRDIIRIDPRVSLEFNGTEGFDRISCLGGNDRANTFTVDGIVQADVFGLNGTPFAARNSLPLPFDAVDQTSVEFAPFDVEYSDFTGCLINVVTKAGSNEFSGSAFVTYFDGGMQNDEVVLADGRRQNVNAGEEKRWGATLSGPIFKDRLFFSFAYEEVDLIEGAFDSPSGAGIGNPELGVTLAEFNRFREIAQRVYGQDTGPFATSLANTSLRYFGRLDGQITDDHRVVVTYQRLDESKIEDDSGAAFSGINSFENEGTISDYYSAQLYSQWSDSVSTEFRMSRADVSDVQGPLGFDEANGANPVPRLIVGTNNLPPAGSIAGGRNGQLFSGPGFSRALNQLDSKVDQARFIMNIDAGGGHNIKLGAEYNNLEVFNLFLQNATGTLYFANLNDFENGLIAGGTNINVNSDRLVANQTIGADINVPVGFDVNNSAAEFSRTIYSFFAQDDWQATDQLSINAGVRVQLFDGGAPSQNNLYSQRIGFSNSTGFSSLDPQILPRLSATYDFDNDGFLSNTRLTGGVGIFSGGDPVVFFSNAFSNDGFTSGLGNTNSCAAGQLTRGAGGKISVLDAQGRFTGIPQCVANAGQAIAAAGGGNVQTVDPNLDVPTAVRANIGLSTEFGTESGFFSNWRLNLDYIYTRFNDTLTVVDLLQQIDPSQGLNGRTVDGRPIYRPIDPLRAGCSARIVGTGGNNPQWTGVSPACFNSANSTLQEFLQLTNGPSFEAHNASLILTKRFSKGIITDGGSVNVNFGYAFTDSQQSPNARDATAGSFFDGTAAFDPQNLGVSQSGFETRHNFTMSMAFQEEFIEDYKTSFGFFFRASEGRPYSLVYDDATPTFRGSQSAEENILAYIPTGANDPNIAPAIFNSSGVRTGGSDPAAVAAFIDALQNGVPIGTTGRRQQLNCNFTPGQTVERNQCRNPWVFDLDLRISQELPFLGKLTGIKKDRIELFADVVNVLNLIDDEANSVRTLGGSDGRVDLVDGSYDAQGRYVITGFTAAQGLPDTIVAPSVWRVQIGARYEF
ncbi:TonB-dependent receptor [Porphyrobacter sp. ULC335]|uniref:TonB-dependent receptor n=1 Tax=Porphyrobacter sp. ULC335 TaxID=2854260 RepID=UPI00221EBE8E|nr:TonB-dependent receptor [Porphyrobacter sp. ULC335]UYV16792.1 TonB-dependent receptor [Porphyrobacter sp. ULC335]